MTPSKPYIIRAIYDWIVDNNCTPHVLVDAGIDGVVVPSDYVNDGQIVLNISPTAVVSLHLGNDGISFSGRFGGVPMDVFLPLNCVLGVYARENGEGMVFDGDGDIDDTTPPDPDPISPDTRQKPSLTLVK